MLLTGPTGVGKSYIACALGNFAARQGYTVLYLRAPRLFETLLQSKADGTHLKTLTRLAKVELLILDDLFLLRSTMPSATTCSKSSRIAIDKAPTLITSQCPTKDWHHIIGEPTIADAILDRFTSRLQNRTEGRIDPKEQEMKKGDLQVTESLKLREKLQRRFAPTPAAISGTGGRNGTESLAELSEIPSIDIERLR